MGQRLDHAGTRPAAFKVSLVARARARSLSLLPSALPFLVARRALPARLPFFFPTNERCRQVGSSVRHLFLFFVFVFSPVRMLGWVRLERTSGKVLAALSGVVESHRARKAYLIYYIFIRFSLSLSLSLLEPTASVSRIAKRNTRRFSSFYTRRRARINL